MLPWGMLITIDANFIQKLPSLSTIVDQGVCALRMVWEGWFVFGIHILIKKNQPKSCKFWFYLKSIQIQSYFWSVFSPYAGKYGPEIT